jgi:hypothetical protein
MYSSYTSILLVVVTHCCLHSRYQQAEIGRAGTSRHQLLTDGCLGSRGKEHTEIEIATFRDQEHDKHYLKDLMQLLATYRNMVGGKDVNFSKESLQRLSVVCVEAAEQGLLAD